MHSRKAQRGVLEAVGPSYRQVQYFSGHFLRSSFNLTAIQVYIVTLESPEGMQGATKVGITS